MNEQNDFGANQGKISRGEAGLGTVSPDMVQERARELAKMDGRTEANESDRASARAELSGPGAHDLAPETTNQEMDSLTGWAAPEARGQRVERVLPEDEANVGEILVEEGLEEADHDQRLSAARENPPREA